MKRQTIYHGDAACRIIQLTRPDSSLMNTERHGVGDVVVDKEGIAVGVEVDEEGIAVGVGEANGELDDDL